jgi:hypothetical protein
MRSEGNRFSSGQKNTQENTGVRRAGNKGCTLISHKRFISRPLCKDLCLVFHQFFMVKERLPYPLIPEDGVGQPGTTHHSEVERYIVMPGKACAYKIGEIKMVALREKARRALGEKFNLRQFHQAALKHGSMPLLLLEQVVEAYAANRSCK